MFALQVWDMRKGTAIMDMKNHEDYISDITVDQNKRILLTARYRPRSPPLVFTNVCSLVEFLKPMSAAGTAPWASST